PGGADAGRKRPARGADAPSAPPQPGSGRGLRGAAGQPAAHRLALAAVLRGACAGHPAALGAAGRRCLPGHGAARPLLRPARRGHRRGVQRAAEAVTSLAAGLGLFLTLVLTVGVGFYARRFARTTSDFLVAARAVP